MIRLTFSACLSVALLACATPREEPEPAAAPVAVRVAAVRRGAISATLTTSGETAALSVLRLASPVAGRVTELTVQPGDRLAAGAVGARVLPLENEATLHGLGVLADAGALGGEQPLARRLAGEIHDIPLRVPFAAVVAERLHNPGEQVAASDVLLELFDPQTLVVLAQIPIRDSGSVHPELPVEVEIGGARLAGHVAALLPAVSPQALTVAARIALSAPVRPPLLHAAAVCHITTARHADALLIPLAALVSSTVATQGTVMVAEDGVARRRDVALGLRNRDEIEVTAGLVDGEQLITEGNVGLPDGTAVVAQPAAADAPPRETP